MRKAIISYNRRHIGSARAAAQRVIDDERSSNQARSDAQYIVEHIESLVTRRQARAESLEAEKDYLQAMEIYEWLAATMRKEPEGEAARTRLEEMKADREIKREIKATGQLEKLLEKLDGQPDGVWQQALEAFASANEGTRAAQQALQRRP